MVGTIPMSDNVKKIMFKDRKYALEFPSTGGSLKVFNQFQEPKSLVLFYMTTGPAPSIYPKTVVKINDSQEKSVIIEPLSYGFDFPVHVSDSTIIGTADLGENVVSIMPLETTQQLFRVVAVALVDEAQHEQISTNFIGGRPTML